MVTGALVGGFLFWDRSCNGPPHDLWNYCVRATNGSVLGGLAVLCCMVLGLVLFIGTFVWVVLVIGGQLVRWLTRPPSSAQDADYDDGQ
jgi:hypothetical protein